MEQYRNKVIPVIRWTARILSGLIVILILFIFIGEGMSDGFGGFLHLTLRENLMTLAFIGVFIGLIIGWKWELTGGILILAGLILFYLLDFLFSGTFPRGVIFPYFAIPGILFILSGLLSKIEFE